MSVLLLESGDTALLESGFDILLEDDGSAPVTVASPITVTYAERANQRHTHTYREARHRLTYRENR